MRSQALIAVAAALVACGQERVTEPIRPLSGQVGDSAAVLHAVAAAIVEMNARAGAARADPNFPASCRERAFGCWSLELDGWQLAPDDNAGITLARLLEANAVIRPKGTKAPACSWPSASPGSGHRVTVNVRFKDPDFAEVLLSRRCDNPPGYTHDVYGAWEVFEVRRLGKVWTATLASIAVT